MTVVSAAATSNIKSNLRIHFALRISLIIATFRFDKMAPARIWQARIFVGVTKRVAL
jgi:hypothetical protein